MTEPPEVSVVIPTRDRWSLLTTRGLPSALEQEAVALEVIVVDDGSADGTAERLARGADRRVRVVRVERSSGMAAARNAGVAAARGPWVAFLDDDDMWSPTKLRRQLDALSATGADFVYAGALAVDGSGRVLDRLYLPPADELAAKLTKACVIPAGCSNVVIRASLVRALGGFDETLVHVADWDLWIRLVGRGRGAVCDEILVAYLLHDGNMHAVDDPSAELETLVRKHAQATPAREITPDLVGYARWVAAQRSRAGRHGEAASVYLRSAIRHRSPGNLVRALDALTGKRAGALARRSHGDGPPPVEAPGWLRRFAA